MMIGEDKNERTNTTQSKMGMIAAWRALATAVGDLRYNMFQLVAYNIIWFIVSLPVITLPPATAALYVIAHEINYRRPVTFVDFFRAMRDYWWIGWRWGAMNFVVMGLIVANWYFYSTIELTPLVWFFAGLGLGWIILQLYCFPILLEQEDPRLRLALRNALALLIGHSRFTFIHSIVTATFVFISVVIPYLWMLLTPALLMFIYTRAVRYLLTVDRGQDPDDI